ncbi:hypothetical protein V6N12_016043 [Hibiscus sabdariffa]|uniref:Uncharacterized protein n=1 Tax=Hibiscus sabdariffa TaxID=183260 RepID=A0ABR2AD66_9ROSI
MDADHVLRKEDGVSSNQSRMELKRIHGYVEEEELWKMKRRLVGVMATGPKDLIFPEEGWELHTLRADEDERDMGFKPLREITDSGSRKYMDLWAKAVDEKFNEGLSNAISDSFIMGLQLEVVLLGKA